VLLGRRPSSDQWADAYVFPGGRVDPVDCRVRPATELRPHVDRCLQRAASPARARALGIAAIRELMEETGLLLGKPAGSSAGRSRDWLPFSEEGLAPALDQLDLLCRAVTPPYRTKRFNARFFVAPAEAVSGTLQGNGELADLRWVEIEEARSFNLPRITERVLSELEEWLGEEPKRSARGRVPVYKTVYGKQRRTLE
jgi:8-oxo-dGTP pyrophosphatase MutT (NUDIX family)